MTKKEAERLLCAMAVQSATIIEGVLVARKETTWTIGNQRRVFLIAEEELLASAAEHFLIVHRDRTL